jgi:hypothetical protein
MGQVSLIPRAARSPKEIFRYTQAIHHSCHFKQPLSVGEDVSMPTGE